METKIRTLSPADFFPLLGLIRKRLSKNNGGYIDPLKKYPRFLKPTKELMANHIGAFRDDKLISAISIFPSEYFDGEKVLKTAEIELWSENDNINEGLMQKAVALLKEKEIDYIWSFQAHYGFDPLSQKECMINRATVCDNETIEEVFAFMHLKVLTKYDLIALKEIYTSRPHVSLSDEELISGLSSHDTEPIVIKNSSGAVVGLILAKEKDKLSAFLFKNQKEAKPILKAYFIFYQLENISIKTQEKCILELGEESEVKEIFIKKL